MKKQTLFDLASMPKMVLVIVMVVMLGTLFGATSYLLKAPKTDLPIVNPIIETQCEIDSDCELVYVGQDVCPPCDALSEEYQCLNESEKIKIWDEQIERDKFKPITACSPCAVEFDKYICKCENGKCKKVKEDLVGGVIIATDKMEYEQGEEITANLNYKGKIYQWDRFAWSIQKLENDLWIDIKRENNPEFSYANIPNCKNINLNETEECPAVMLYERAMWYEIKDAPKLVWKQFYKTEQKTFLCNFVQRNTATKNVTSSKIEDRFCAVFDKAQPGNYKIRFEYATDINIDDSFDRKIDIKYAESEFTIKEKSALDPMCNEIVKIIGNCDVEVQGYHFDLDTEECAAVNSSGCSIKSPFETLEECQEVCEKSKIDSRDILSDEKVYEILKNFAVRPNAANISDDNILLDAIESQNGDIKKRLKKVEHDLNEIGIGDAIDWRGYVNATTKVCIARSIIYNNLKHTCDLKHDSLLSLEDVDDLLATEEIIPYFLVGFTYFKSGDYAKANYYLDQIILHRQAEIDRWGESYFINTSGEVYEKIYKKTMQVLNEIKIAANS